MQKKLTIFCSVISLILAIILFAYLFTSTERMNRTKEELISQRIEYFSSQYFSLVNTVQVTTRDGKTSVSASFVPEVGAFPIKEEIYKNVANHALQITEFYPEVTHFDYIILWDDYSKNEVMYLTIDEVAVQHLEDIYYEELINQNGGFETSFKRVFSSIVETEETNSWRNKINSNAILP